MLSNSDGVLAGGPKDVATHTLANIHKKASEIFGGVVEELVVIVQERATDT